MNLEIIVKMRDEASKGFKTIEQNSDDFSKKIKTAALQLAGFTGGVYLAVKAVKQLSETLKTAFMAVEDMRLSALNLASLFTTFADNQGKDLAEVYKNAKEYATDLVYKAEELDAKFIGTNKDLMAMFEVLATGGVVLDIRNKKQLDAFLALANAAYLISIQYPNKEVQIRQELRALVEGQIRPTDRLSAIVNTKITGGLRNNVELWKKQGDFIEKTGELLEGFASSVEDIAMTWGAIKTTTETVANRIMREIMGPTYDDIVRTVYNLNNQLLNNRDRIIEIAEPLRDLVYGGWMLVKEAITLIITPLKEYSKIMGDIIGAVSLLLKGWAGILATINLINDAIFGRLGDMGFWDALDARLSKIFERFQDIRETGGELPILGTGRGRNELAEVAKEATILFEYAKHQEELFLEKTRLWIEEWKIYNKKYYDERRIDAKRYYDDQIGAIEEQVNAEKKVLENRSTELSTYYDALIASTPEKTRELNTKLLVELAKLNDEMIMAERRSKNEILKLQFEYTEKMKEYDGDRLGAFMDGWDDAVDAANKAYTAMKDAGKKTADALSKSFSDIFFDVFTGKLKTFKDYWKSFWNSMARIMSDELSRVIFAELFGKSIRQGGGGGGGLIYGLGEFAMGALQGLGLGGGSAGTIAGVQSESAIGSAIAKSAGGFPGLSRERAAAPTPIIINNNISAMDAESFSQYCAKNPAAIINPILSNINKHGPMVGAIRKAL